MGEGQLVSYPLYTQLPASISTQTPKKPSLILFSSNDPSNACLRKTHQLYLKKKNLLIFSLSLILVWKPLIFAFHNSSSSHRCFPVSHLSAFSPAPCSLSSVQSNFSEDVSDQAILPA